MGVTQFPKRKFRLELSFKIPPELIEREGVAHVNKLLGAGFDPSEIYTFESGELHIVANCESYGEGFAVRDTVEAIVQAVPEAEFVDSTGSLVDGDGGISHHTS